MSTRALARSGRWRTSARRPLRRTSSRRKFTWVPAIFGPNVLAPGNISELTIATVSTLLDLTLGRGTIVAIYGRLSVVVDFPEVEEDTVTGAWGLRLKESDAAASTTAFSPINDGASTEWMHWRGISLVKGTAAGDITDEQGGIANQTEDFVIRNPRKITREDELVMLIENNSTSEGLLLYTFWCRVGILLP